MENLIKREIKYPFLSNPVEIYERPCGHKIVLAKKEGELVNISSWVKTGSINENEENNGISHFLEHLMFKGTTKHKAGYFDKTLEAKGAIVNAATWKDYTFYYVTLPKGKNNKYLYEAIDLHSDMMLDPIIPQEEIGDVFDLKDTTVKTKRERHVVIEEIRMRKDQPWTLVYNACNNAMYKNHPYKRDVIGTPEIISQIKRETVLEYYKEFYTPNNITTIVVGDFNNQEILNILIEKFNFTGRPNRNKNIYEIDKHHDETVFVRNTSKINTGFIMYGYLCPEATKLKEIIALEMLSVILGEGQSSRLNQNLIELKEKPIFNMISTDFYSFRDGGNFFIQGNFSPNKEDEAISSINTEINSILNEGLNPIEFKKAKKRLKVNFANNAETVSDIADTIGYYMTVCDDLTLCDKYLETLENIKIDEVNEIAKEYLNIKRATISILKPDKE